MLFLIFSVLVANPKNLPYTVTNPTPRGLLNRDMHVQYVLCTVITYFDILADLWINRVRQRLQVLFVVAGQGK